MTARVEVTLSWLDGRVTQLGMVAIECQGIEPDDAADALLAGLAATEGRTYTVESAEIVETTRRAPAAIRLPGVVAARPVTRPPAPPRAPETPGTSQGAAEAAPSLPLRRP